jgi:hypothetical protein
VENEQEASLDEPKDNMQHALFCGLTVPFHTEVHTGLTTINSGKRKKKNLGRCQWKNYLQSETRKAYDIVIG